MAGVYIHVPWCRSKCGYCAFHSSPRGLATLPPAWAAAVADEWRRRKDELEGEAVRTVYVGGGTPSVLPPALLAEVIAMVSEGSAPREVTVEANPDDISTAWTDVMLAPGLANRVSMGVQSLDDGELAFAGRRHDAAGARRAVDTLRRAGCVNLSLDLIIGLPGQTPASWLASLQGVIAMRPEHVSVYLLQWEEPSRFMRLRSQGRLVPSDDDDLAERYELARAMLAEAGYEHYEISNFALPGHRSRHNSSYWDCRTPYLGLGPAAHSFTRGRRSHNGPGLTSWRRNIDQETPQEAFNDLVMTRLRTLEGLDIADARHRFGNPLVDALLKDAAPLLADSRLVATEDAIAIPPSRWLLADAITAELMQ